MHTERLAGRALKQRVYDLLKSADLELAVKELCRLPARQVINPLFSFLYNENQEIKWAAITAMGAVTAKLADEDLESARVIMRRLMWNLNDESGGIGWGSPEAMGEILACNEILAKDYAPILISYSRENGNFQEHVLMQRAVLWGIGRASQIRAHLIRDAAPHLLLYLESGDPTIRGLAAWIMGLLETEEARQGLEHLTKDEAELQIFIDRRFTKHLVKDLAEAALNRLSSRIQ